MARGLRRLALGLASACAVMLAGCASPPKVLHFGVTDAAEGSRIVFPPEPEIPRYLYAGQLTGEENFRNADGSSEGAVEGFFSWLVGLAEGGREAMVLQRPQAGVVDAAGRILVTDVSRPGIFVFDQNAGELQLWDKAEGLKTFLAPIGIALGPDGSVFVADADLAVVARLDAKGNWLGGWGRGVLKRPTGLAYDAAGARLYVADTYDHSIKVFDASGALVQTLGRRGEQPGEFNFPTHLTLAKGELYVTDTMNGRVQVLDPADGHVLRQFGRRGLYVGDMVRPKGVAVDDAGNIYVVESYYDHLLIYNRDGEFLMPIGGLGQKVGKFYLPGGVWTDSRDRVYVADTFNGRVVVFQFLGTGGEGE